MKLTMSKTGSGADYFKMISDRADELTRLANDYLNKFDFLTNDEICQKIYKKAWELFKQADENFNAIPEWVALTVDGWMPYTCRSRNGSLHYTLGFSPASQDAHLRNLLEIAEGRETKELPFPVVCEEIELV